jgi:hypothetical protein
MDPGFSNLPPWLELGYSMTKEADMIFCVVTHADNSTEWCSKYAPLADKVILPEGRVQFIPAPGIKASSNSRATFVFVFTPWGDLSPVADFVQCPWKDGDDAS